jgi:hypothetical protein
MHNKPINIYPAIIFDLKKKVKDYIDELNDKGQIDLDDNGYPYLLKVDQQGQNILCHIVRNGKAESFLLNTRKRKDPIKSWNEEDGYVRKGGKRVVVVKTNNGKIRGERAKKSMEAFENIIGQILRS